jgi:hypothetical protein
VTLHELFGRHVADLKSSHWESGHFVTSCTKCGREMVKLPGLTWQPR